MKNIDEILDRLLPKFIPFFGDLLVDMTPEEKRDFIIKITEAIARGIAEGTIRGNK